MPCFIPDSFCVPVPGGIHPSSSFRITLVKQKTNGPFPLLFNKLTEQEEVIKALRFHEEPGYRLENEKPPYDHNPDCNCHLHDMNLSFN